LRELDLSVPRNYKGGKMVPTKEKQTEPEAKQQTLPGVNPKKYAYDGFLKENPTPTTYEQAEKFFRQHTRTQIKLNHDHDEVRVVLKETGKTEDKEKHEYTIELPLSDKDQRSEQWIELAEKVHAMWLDLEAPKYQQ
jgi:hypothetical protein